MIITVFAHTYFFVGGEREEDLISDLCCSRVWALPVSNCFTKLLPLLETKVYVWKGGGRMSLEVNQHV